MSVTNISTKYNMIDITTEILKSIFGETITEPFQMVVRGSESAEIRISSSVSLENIPDYIKSVLNVDFLGNTTIIKISLP